MLLNEATHFAGAVSILFLIGGATENSDATVRRESSVSICTNELCRRPSKSTGSSLFMQKCCRRCRKPPAGNDSYRPVVENTRGACSLRFEGTRLVSIAWRPGGSADTIPPAAGPCWG